MIASSPGPPKRPEPSFRETAAACVALADLVMGLFQFDSVAGVADDDDGGLGMVVLGAADVASSVGETLGSGARVGTGSGAGATGAGGGGSITGAGDEGASVGLPGRGVVRATQHHTRHFAGFAVVGLRRDRRRKANQERQHRSGRNSGHVEEQV
jgi:hypothetical protein